MAPHVGFLIKKLTRTKTKKQKKNLEHPVNALSNIIYKIYFGFQRNVTMRIEELFCFREYNAFI